MLTVANLGVALGGRRIVSDVGFSVQPGEFLAIVGPNGAGKSTLLRAVAQHIPYTGRIAFDGQDVSRLRGAARARALGMLAQDHAVGYAFTVEEIVRLGRYAYAGGFLGARDASGAHAVDEALRAVGLEGARRRNAATLSGGEVQRVFFAQLLAQDPALMLLDEPTNHLDLAHQRALLDGADRWRRAGRRAVVAVLHDLSLALRYADRTLLLADGRVAALDETRRALARDTLCAVYGMDVVPWMQALYGQWAGR